MRSLEGGFPQQKGNFLKRSLESVPASCRSGYFGAALVGVARLDARGPDS